jgi:hypothetical protein
VNCIAIEKFWMLGLVLDEPGNVWGIERRPKTAPEIASAMKHPQLLWNSKTMAWFCIRCGRTSDHLIQADAERELDQFGCALVPKNGERSEN